MLILIICIVIISLAGIFAIIWKMNEESGKNNNTRPGYRCGSQGCKKTGGGEFSTQRECVLKCNSFVRNDNGNCEQVEGVPWNSFATRKNCLSS